MSNAGDCPYALNLKMNKGFACLKDQVFINCTGGVIKVEKNSEVIELFCMALEQKLKIPGQLFRSDFGERSSVTATSIQVRILDCFDQGRITEEEAFGKLVFLKKWPRKIESESWLKQLDSFFAIRVGELAQARKLEISNSLLDSIESELQERR